MANPDRDLGGYDPSLTGESQPATATGRSATAQVVLQQGGEWLGAVRSWAQWNKTNGSDVTWGSDQELRPSMTIGQLEDAAAHAVAADRAVSVNELDALKAEVERLKDRVTGLHDVLHDYWKIHNHRHAYGHEHDAGQECSLGPLCKRIRAALGGGK